MAAKILAMFAILALSMSAVMAVSFPQPCPSSTALNSPWAQYIYPSSAMIFEETYPQQQYWHLQQYHISSSFARQQVLQQVQQQQMLQQVQQQQILQQVQQQQMLQQVQQQQILQQVQQQQTLQQVQQQQTLQQVQQQQMMQHVQQQQTLQQVQQHQTFQQVQQQQLLQQVRQQQVLQQVQQQLLPTFFNALSTKNFASCGQQFLPSGACF